MNEAGDEQGTDEAAGAGSQLGGAASARDDGAAEVVKPTGAAGAEGGGGPSSSSQSADGLVSLTGLTQAKAVATGLVPNPGAASSAGSTGGSNNTPTDSKGTVSGVESYPGLDKTRERIAYILLGLLASVILIDVLASAMFSNACWVWQRCTVASNSLGLISSQLSSIFTAMIGLVGSVVGFYFGSQKAAAGGG